VNRLATAAVALLLLPVVAGCSGGSAASAAPSGSQITELPAGSHKTASFTPSTTYTVPAGWANTADDAAHYALNPVTNTDNGLYLFHNVQALSQDTTCPRTPEPGVGTTASEMVTWIRSLKGLNVSQPVMVTVSGLQGTQIDVSIKTAWTQSCSFANGLRTVPLFHNAGLDWWLAGEEKLRLTFVDVPNQGTVVADLDSFAGEGFGDLLTQGAPIVQSLQFATQ
jgi:hypothetical protein